jgi:hypothetical protein
MQNAASSGILPKAMSTESGAEANVLSAISNAISEGVPTAEAQSTMTDNLSEEVGHLVIDIHCQQQSQPHHDCHSNGRVRKYSIFGFGAK